MDLGPGLCSPQPVASGCIGLALGPFTHIRVITVKNVTSEGILILTKETRKCPAHNKFIHIGSKVEDYKYSFYPRSITEWNKIPSTTINSPSENIPALYCSWEEAIFENISPGLYNSVLVCVFTSHCSWLWRYIIGERQMHKAWTAL